jgi:uncharacterized protein
MRVITRAPRLAHALLFFAALAMLAGAALAGDLVFPQLTGRVVDEAGILDAATRSHLTDQLAQHEQATHEQIVVVTLKSLQGDTIEDFGYRLGRHWGIGEKGRNTGALLVVAPSERKVRIEVGYGLEDRLTDAQSRIIIEQVILPQFRRGDFNAGVADGTAAMLRVLGGTPLKSAARGGGAQGSQDIAGPALIWLLLVIVFLFFSFRRRSAWPLIVMGGRSGFGYGGGGFGGGGGGGFSGGGGSFGGGGASGSW